MVKRILNLLDREVSGLHEAAYLLAIFAFLSQIFGLIRDRLLAHNFGAGVELDIYYAAFRIPDFIFISVASIFSVSVLIPFLFEKFNISKDQGKDFASNIFSFFFLFIVFVSAIIYFLVPSISKLILPGITDPEAFNQLVKFTRILLLSPILLGLSNFLASITQMQRKFYAYAISPVLYNLGIIIGVIFLLPFLGLEGVIIGVIIGAILHLAVQLPAIISSNLMPKFRFVLNWNSIKRVVYLSIPRTIALSSNHIALIFFLALASLMTEGSISVFSLSFNLQSVPLSIIGVSYSVAAFPTLSRLYNVGDHPSFFKEILSTAKHVIFWSLPITVLFIVLRAQIVRTLLGSGEFSWSDTRLVAAALALFAVSVLAQSMIMLLVRGYYSASRTKKPLYINLFSSVLAIIFGFVLVYFYESSVFFQSFIESLLRVEGIAGTKILMLPLGYSLGMLFNVIILWRIFEKDFGKMSKYIVGPFFQALSSSIIMGFITYLFLQFFDDIFNINTLFGIFMQGFLSGILGILSAVLLLKLLGNKEIEEIMTTLHRKIWKADTIVPEQENLQ